MNSWCRKVFFVAACLYYSTAALGQATNPDLFVSSSQTNSVKRYDGATGAYEGDFIAPGAGGLVNTQDLLYGPDGNLYVSGFGTTAVLRFNPVTGEFIDRFTSFRNIIQATKMTFHTDGMLYISQWGGDEKVLRYNATSGVYVDAFTSVGVVNGMEFDWDADGNFIIASWGENGTDGTIQRFDSDGNFVDILIATNVGGLQGPVNLWIDGTELFVVDWTRGQVLRYNVTTGTFLGLHTSGMTRSEGWAFDSSGNLYVPDWHQNRINRFDENGDFVDFFTTSGGMLNPNAVLFQASPSEPVGIETDDVPNVVQLTQNYPNPFTSTTTIEYSIVQRSHVEFVVYNMQGQAVRTISRGIESAGRHRLEWDGLGDGGTLLPAGMFVLRMRAGDLSATHFLSKVE